MSKLNRVLCSPVISVFLIFVCVFGLFRYTYVSSELKRERGSQAYYQLNDARFLTRYVDMKLEVDGPEAIDGDLLTYVNHLVFVSGRPLLMFEFLLQDGYQSLLRELSAASGEQEKEQLLGAIELFHEDIREIAAFADSECQIVLSRDEDGNPTSTEGDFINYAKLTNPKSRVYEEFNALVLEKMEDNRQRLRAVR